MGKLSFPVRAFLASALEVTYAIPAEHLGAILAPGLELETHEGFGFIAVTLTQAHEVRPAFLPRFLGASPFWVDYHLLVRHPGEEGRTTRGLQPLRRLTNHRTTLFFGNLCSPTPHRRASVEISQDAITTSITVLRAGHQEVRAITCSDYAETVPLPSESPFADWSQARRHTGFPPHHFTSSRGNRTLLRSRESVRGGEPQPAQLLDFRARYIESPLWKGTPRLAAVFMRENAEVRWKSEGVLRAAGRAAETPPA